MRLICNEKLENGKRKIENANRVPLIGRELAIIRLDLFWRVASSGRVAKLDCYAASFRPSGRSQAAVRP
jgi:hypothetical protein